MTEKGVERVEDLKLWQRAREFWQAINAIIDRPRFVADRRLREQLKDAADSIVANIVEGFHQPTDRAFANYLYTSKASTAEARTRLKMAMDRQYITSDEFDTRDDLGDQISRMATGLIKYLVKSNRRGRGLGRRRDGAGNQVDEFVR
jgi:four helix bundle protein